MKKVIALVLALIMVVTLCSCAVSDYTINNFLDTITHSFNSNDSKLFEKYSKSENFPSLVNSYLEDHFTDEDYYHSISLMRRLNEWGYNNDSVFSTFEKLIYNRIEEYINKGSIDAAFELINSINTDYDYQTETLKSLIVDALNPIKEDAFTNSDCSKMMDYIELIKEYSDDYYITIIESFPYDRMKDYIEKNGKKIICKDGVGGYYDKIKDQFVNEDYWYSPLYNMEYHNGDVGRYHQIKEYEFYGDLAKHTRIKQWYGTSAGDSNNEYYYSWYYKEHYLCNDKDTLILDVVFGWENVGTVFGVENDKDSMICAVDTANIHIIHDREMVTIAYS